MEEQKKKVKEEDAKYLVGEVAVKTERVIVRTKDEQQYDLYSAVAKIMNDIEKLKETLT